MGKPKKVALHAAHVASTDPRDLTGVPRDLHGLGLIIINWHTVITANKATILHQMLNEEQGCDTRGMAFKELWAVSEQTGTGQGEVSIIEFHS